MSKLRSNDDGVVAIVVTVLIMIVVSITTIGMAKLASREQRQALDRQLSSQAYYAAESGINDTIAEIQANRITSNITQCSPATGVGAKNLSQISIPVPPTTNTNELVLDSILSTMALQTQAKSSYTCVLASLTPLNLEYAQVTTDNSVVADVASRNAADTAPGNTIQKLVVGWEDASGGVGFKLAAGCNNLNASESVPAVKLDVTPLTGPAGNTTYSRDDLMKRTMTYYLNPCTGGGAPFYTTVNFPNFITSGTSINTSSGAFVSGNCDGDVNGHVASFNSPLRCNVNIDLNSINGVDRFLIRAKPIYRTARITVLGLNGSGSPEHLKGGQTVIDVTGKASDVVKRTQVRISNRTPYLYAIESTGAICKRLIAVQPPYSSLTGVPSTAITNNPIDAQICRAAQN